MLARCEVQLLTSLLLPFPGMEGLEAVPWAPVPVMGLHKEQFDAPERGEPLPLDRSFSWEAL